MTDKQINTCEFLNICQTDCNGTLEDTEMCHCYEIYKQLKRKERECEGWKARSDEWMSKCEQETKLREFTNEQLDQLKAELEQEQTLKEMYFTYYKAKHSDIKGEFFKLKAENEKLKQTLAEIKEFVKNMNKECFYDDFECKYCDMKNGCTYQGKIKILQKISECEVEDDRQS